MSDSGRDSRLIVKAFFAGFLGCLGALLVAALIVVGLLAAGKGAVENRLRSLIPGLDAPLPTLPIPLVLPGAGTPPALPALPVPLPNVTLPGAETPIAIPSLPVPLPNVTLPNVPAPAIPPAAGDCYSALEAWVSASELGDAVTNVAKDEGVFPVVQSSELCGLVRALLVDGANQTVNERALVILIGRTGFGNFNLLKRLAPGSYHMDFLHGDVLLHSVPLTVKP